MRVDAKADGDTGRKGGSKRGTSDCTAHSLDTGGMPHPFFSWWPIRITNPRQVPSGRAGNPIIDLFFSIVVTYISCFVFVAL